MPKYEYECKKDGTVKEVERSINDKERIPKCPDCRSKMYRIFTAIPTHFRGNGWGGE